jgi:Leucine-rich repeat (LRR) protein
MVKGTQDIIASRLIPNKTRIRDSDGFIATVRYVGPVASAKKSDEIYAGVEWDDPTRGIHDGSVICRKTNQLVRHFSLSNSCQTGGSFLKLSKIDTGVELNLKLIQSRYVDSDAPLVAPNNILPYCARTSSGRDKPIEFLGELQVRKKQQLERLNDISLRGLGISSIACGNERELLVKTFEHLQELDVAGNLFSDWNSLFELLRIFPRLIWLSFASNKINDIPSDFPVRNGEFSCLRVLNLNRCSIGSFSTILSLDKLCPNLEELCVAYSDLSGMTLKEDDNDGMDDGAQRDFCVTEFQHLLLFDCSNCQLTSWRKQVRRLSHWPKLETLILDENMLASVDIEEAQQDFQSLKNLQIAGTAISSWQNLESLSKLPNLTTLRFRKCPLTDKIGTGEARAGTIARLPSIQNLNASKITPKERLEAERRYVSSVSREILSMQPISIDKDKGGDTKELSLVETFKKLGLVEKYPRFEELVEKHKESMLIAHSSVMASSTISHTAMDITIRSMAAESCTIEPLKRHLPASIKVGRLKTMCSRAFGLDVELQVLYFRNEVKLNCFGYEFYSVCLVTFVMIFSLMSCDYYVYSLLTIMTMTHHDDTQREMPFPMNSMMTRIHWRIMV